jgi:hypothetical protein
LARAETLCTILGWHHRQLGGWLFLKAFELF